VKRSHDIHQDDEICEGAKPLFFLDYFATSKLKISSSVKIIDGII